MTRPVAPIAPGAAAGDAKPPRSRHVPPWARWVITAGAIAVWWTIAGDDIPELARAIARMPAWAIGAAVSVGIGMYFPAALRWRLLLRAYGGHALPPVRELFHLSLVGQFYNTVIPGNVGGDLLRGHWTRRILPSGGAYLVVLVERLFGLCGLLVLVSAGLVIRPWLEPLRFVGVGGVVIALTILGAVASARRIGPRIGGRVGATLSKLPPLAHRAPLPFVLALSITIHALQALMGYLLFAGMGVYPEALDLLVLVPVALAANYLPTVAGLGARETAFVLLFGAVGVGAVPATVASLGMLLAQLVVGGLGGLLELVRRPMMRSAG
jgi:glycosyltransferase 2 family protein